MAIRRDHAELFSFARTALTNARDLDPVQSVLADYGYDPDQLNDGLALLDTAEASAQQQKMEYAEQYSATAAVNEAAATLRATFSRHRRLARIAHDQGSEGYRKLGLDGEIPRALPALLAKARTFYTVLTADTAVRGPLERFRVDQQAAEIGLAEVQATDAALVLQRKERGEAQVATKLRDDAVALLSGYMRDFVAVARIALGDYPQRMEKLGLMERS